MKNQKCLDDIREIKELMNRSSKFLSLSGLSGVFAGFYALAGVVMAEWAFGQYHMGAWTREQVFFFLIFLAFAVLVLSLGTALWFSYRKAQKRQYKMWDVPARRMVAASLVPLLTGGLWSLILVLHGDYGLLVPSMLVFYGLSLTTASYYTYGMVYYLGLAEILTGLLALLWPGYAVWWWALGFGVFHILYGLLMYVKFDRH